MQAAANTFNERKLHALARALAAGLRNGGASVDVENLVVRALADLEIPHIRALSELTGTSVGQPRALKRDAGSGAAIYATLERHGLIANDDERRQHAAIEKAIKERLAWWDKELGHQIKTGSKHQRTPPQLELDLTPRWYITPFGVRCLRYLRSTARASSSGASSPPNMTHSQAAGEASP